MLDRHVAGIRRLRHLLLFYGSSLLSSVARSSTLAGVKILGSTIVGLYLLDHLVIETLPQVIERN